MTTQLTESKAFIAIRDDNGQIRAMTSSFARPLGFVITDNNTKWKVCMLHPDKTSAGYYLHTFNKTTFRFYDFNTSDGQKLTN